MTDINEILKDHVTLDMECIDRIYLNPEVPGQLVKFLHHRGYEIPSPAMLGKMTNEYKAAKVCTYAPYAVKICLNGHEWAKRQARKRGIAFEALDNGFLSCEDPDYLEHSLWYSSTREIHGCLGCEHS